MTSPRSGLQPPPPEGAGDLGAARRSPWARPRAAETIARVGVILLLAFAIFGPLANLVLWAFVVLAVLFGSGLVLFYIRLYYLHTVTKEQIDTRLAIFPEE